MVAAFEDESEHIVGSVNMGEGELDFKFLPAGGQFHLRGSDEALTAYGGLVAWDHFLERCGVFAQLAGDYPLPRTSPNATPVIDILKAFSLNCLVGGTRFAHCRRLQDDTVVVLYGNQEDAAIGYNPQKPGRPSHHPLACVMRMSSGSSAVGL